MGFTNNLPKNKVKDTLKIKQELAYFSIMNFWKIFKFSVPHQAEQRPKILIVCWIEGGEEKLFVAGDEKLSLTAHREFLKCHQNRRSSSCEMRDVWRVWEDEMRILILKFILTLSFSHYLSHEACRSQLFEVANLKVPQWKLFPRIFLSWKKKTFSSSELSLASTSEFIYEKVVFKFSTSHFELH